MTSLLSTESSHITFLPIFYSLLRSQAAGSLVRTLLIMQALSSSLAQHPRPAQCAVGYVSREGGRNVRSPLPPGTGARKKYKYRNWPRWRSRKIQSSPPLMSTPKSERFAEQPSTKKTGNYQERTSTKRRNHTKMARRSRLTI